MIIFLNAINNELVYLIYVLFHCHLIKMYPSASLSRGLSGLPVFPHKSPLNRAVNASHLHILAGFFFVHAVRSGGCCRCLRSDYNAETHQSSPKQGPIVGHRSFSWHKHCRPIYYHQPSGRLHSLTTYFDVQTLWNIVMNDILVGWIMLRLHKIHIFSTIKRKQTTVLFLLPF